MTSGNKKVSAFSNMQHRDLDYLATRFLPQCMKVLKMYRDTISVEKNSNDIFFMNHIKKRYNKNKKFPIYTTCGYKVFKSSHLRLQYYAYFLYNSFGIGISLTECDSFYHTFDASFMNHQTSVPVCVDNDYVYFNHESFFTFAWGNGKSDKRLWLEERGHVITGSRVSQSDFERYFESFSDTDKNHVKTNGWI